MVWAPNGWLRVALVVLLAAAGATGCRSPKDVGHHNYGSVDEPGASPVVLTLAPFRMSGERVAFRLCGPVQLGLGEITHELPSLGVFDLNALLPSELPRLDGLLALDALAETPFTLELDSGNLAKVLLASHVRVDSSAGADEADEVTLTLGTITTAPFAFERRELIVDGALNAEFLERYARATL